jgi:hypothetical protein
VAAALTLGAPLAVPRAVLAQTADRDTTTAPHPADSAKALKRRFYLRMSEGFVASILLHESAHFASSYLMGYHPHLGFDKHRPTVFSGINETGNHHDQFIFSAAGLTVQDLLDELILDVPHNRGGPFERGILTGGIGTTLFYITAGRNARVSDISVMARTSSLSKGQLSLIFGSVAALHAFRVGRDGRYARFFAAPSATGRLEAGVSVTTR